MLDLSTCDLISQQRQALLYVQILTGNDYVSLFLRKGKKVCRKMVKHVHSENEVLTVFVYLGKTTQVSLEQTTTSLKEYVCQHYGEKRVNSALVFRQNYSSNSEMADLSLEPPCSISL